MFCEREIGNPTQPSAAAPLLPPTTPTGSYSVPSEHNYNVVIAAVPLMALAAVALLLCILLLSHRAYWASAGAPPPLWAAEDVAEGSGAEVSAAQLRLRVTVEELR